MEVIIKNHTYNINLTRDSHNRRAVQYYNSIVKQFKLIGLTEDDIEIKKERMAMRKAPANITWWVKDFYCHFSFSKMNSYVDNLLVVLKVIEFHIKELLSEKITFDEFIDIFKEDDDISEKRIKAREFFGLEKDHIDLDIVNKKYKLLAKELHPDMETGDMVKFKELNMHHKILKRELE